MAASGFAAHAADRDPAFNRASNPVQPFASPKIV
jgi:hypothetical protein